MSWLADLAGKAEHLLNNIDEQTGAALRNHSVVKPKTYDVLSSGWSPKLSKRQPRNPVRKPIFIEHRSNSPPKKLINIPNRNPITNSKPVECAKEIPSKLRKSPVRKSNFSNFDLNHCPRTLVGDEIIKESTEIILNEFGLKQRRYSLPDGLNDQCAQKIQNLEVENSMLKNELTVMNKEVSELLDRLRISEDDLKSFQSKLSSADAMNSNLNQKNNLLLTKIEELKTKMNELVNTEITKYKDNNDVLEEDLAKMKQANEELKDKIQEINTQNSTAYTKLENELRHAQTYIGNLQSDLEKSQNECHRLEKDWEAYKVRVKAMLQAKDKEIKSFQDGMNFNDDTKILMDQIESLRDEREELNVYLSKIRDECNDMKQYVEELELRSESTERLINALREALKEERIAKSKVDTDCLMLRKELKTMQMETGQTIASLQTLLEEKASELSNLKDSSTTVNPTTDSSALNVADYETTQESMDTEKIQFLTQTLVTKQGKIDSLMANNNMLKIQLQKLETKFNNEVSYQKAQNHSVVNLNDGDCRNRSRNNKYIPDSTMSRVSMRIGILLKRNPLLRILIIIYMVGLHLWVALVLLTYTPEEHPIIRNKT